ncbi:MULTISPECIES: hypothetical protein [Streptomyces]|uniref:hypothetical protein n=1 Tax=Streptomyces TaxID=1883 RepID=UPI0004C8C0B2|nr:hypothetical protein [Streptomyces sp. NRRL S-237]
MTSARQHRTGTTRFRTLLTAAAIAATVAAVTIGCTKENKAASPPSPTASPTTSADPQAADKDALVSVYRAFWDAQLKVYASGSAKDTGIEKVAGDKAYSKVQTTRAYYVDRGYEVKGAPAHSPQVTALNMAATPPSATITDCLDTTDYYKVEKSTGKKVETADDNRRHVATYEALRIAGAWQIRDFDISRDGRC